MDVRVIYRTCPTCGHRFGQPDDPGRKRRFCSDACKQAAYRARKRKREQARQRAQDDARRREREEQTRRARDRARRNPPPHAGSSRFGPFCGTCGGHRGPHTFHHDQAAHDRARRRYEGLHAKAASTGFPEEADACRAKAEQLRAKYGI
jgi:predicted nucleic acid-binding Zn ribbon protein